MSFVKEKLAALLRGQIPEKVPADTPAGEEDRQDAAALNEMIDSVAEIREFLLPLSRGELHSPRLSAGNYLASPLKELHSRLLHLTWQAEQVTRGDYSQRVDFMGDFSRAFNTMVETLAQRERELNERIAGLQEALTKLGIVEEELRRQSTTDSLTGARNRRSFEDQLDRELSRARRYRHPLSLAMLDVDGFKRINDEFGHPAGDEALIGLTRLVLSIIRQQDAVFRMGGDEFAILMPDTGVSGARQMAERLCRIVREHRLVLPDGGEIRFTVSVGVAELTEVTPAGADLCKRADDALLLAKQHGRDRTEALP